MDQNEKYQYNFEYSLANYHPIRASYASQQQSMKSLQKDEQSILRRSNQLIEYQCFQDAQTQRSIKTLLTHFIQIYGNVAYRLYRICSTLYQNNQNVKGSTKSIPQTNRKIQQLLESQRQNLIQSTGQLSKIFFNQKQKYYKLIALCTSSAVYKILKLQKNISQLQYESIFHTIYWQITGLHSTSQILKKLLNETFNITNFNSYIINEAPIKVNPIYKNKSIQQSLIGANINNSMSNSCQNVHYFNLKVLQSARFQKNERINFIAEDKAGQQLAFSKKIKRKQKLFNRQKQNCNDLLNQVQQTGQINPSSKNNIQTNYYTRQNQKAFQAKTANQKQKDNSTQKKMFNFKKDRIAFFQNYSKSKSTKKMTQDVNSANKKPTFKNFLEQKRLQF